MHSIIAALERHSLIDPLETTKRLTGLAYPALCTVAEDIHEALYTSARENPQGFEDSSLESLNLLASSSIRGDRCDFCWPRKFEMLARYSALYADRVIFPYRLSIPKFDAQEGRADFAKRVVGLIAVRELIEADLLRPVIPEFHFCSDCAKRARHNLKQVERAAIDFVEQHMDDFQFIYRPVTAKMSVLEIQGPDRYVDHGAALVYSTPPRWAPHRVSSIGGRPGKVLSKSFVRRANLLKGFVFRTFGGDLVFQQLYGYRYGTKYLTDLPGEAEFFSATSTNDELAARTAAVCARLTHTVPLFRDVSLSTVVRIRREDPEAFLLYRQTLGRIVRDNLNGRQQITDDEAKQLYHDVLEPELIKLARQARAASRSYKAKVIAKTLVPAVTVTVGVFGGLLPSSIAELARVIGATALLTQATEALLGTNTDPTEVRNHNLYFLLQLAKADGFVQ